MKLEDCLLYGELIRRKVDPEYFCKIKSIFKYCEDTLSLVSNVFTNYTQHDMGHAIRVSNYMYHLINNIDEVSDLDILIMIYSSFLHDIGMVVIDDEIELLKVNKLDHVTNNYKVVKSSIGNEKLALQECIRPIHAIRSKDHILKMSLKHKEWFQLSGASITTMAESIAQICESHNETIDWVRINLKNISYKGCNSYNGQYIALILRLGDLLDIDEQRTPEYLYELIHPTGYSDQEWKQHFIIDNTEKIFLTETEQKVIKIYGKSKLPDIHRKFLKYIDYLNQELLGCITLSESFKEKKYTLNLRAQVENNVKTEGFTFSDFKLELDYQAVTNLLMGENIYGSPKYGLRELIQNSIDACKVMLEISGSLSEYEYTPYKPFINICLDEDKNEAIIIDNGVGMSIEILKKYFLNVGVSYYASTEYKYKGLDYNPIGNYGIGFLSCFMLSNDVKVITNKCDNTTVNIISLKKDSEFICLSQENKQRKQGTDIFLDLNCFKKIFMNITEINTFIETNFINCSIPIQLFEKKDGKTTSIECNLIELKQNTKNIARLDNYLNDICGYIEISNSKVGFAKELEDISKDSSHIYNRQILSVATNNINLLDFINDDEISYLSVPVITTQDEELFNKYFEVLEDFDEAYDKLNQYDYVNIFSFDKNLEECVGLFSSQDQIIGDYTFENFCETFQHSKHCQTSTTVNKIQIIHSTINTVLPYSSKVRIPTKGFYEKQEKLFVKNVYISDANIIFPFLVAGINIKYSMFNVCSKSIVPNISRKNLSQDDLTKISYAIGKALHLWLLDNIELSEDEKSLLNKFISEKYQDTNIFLK